MKKMFSPLITLSLLLTTALPTLAAPTGGQLIKASGAAVYYMGMDGKRYVFPNEATYRSWYSDFSTVQTITDSELAQITIGGNVTYRPGTRLVKITTDPKVYAIAGNGTLRWVTSESLATTLFGSSWATQVDDIPDAFFVNYRVGTSIQSTSDYDRNQEMNLSTTIALDRSRGATPAPTPPSTPSAPTSTQPTAPTSTTSTPPPPASPTSTSATHQGTLILQGTGPITSGGSFTIMARPAPSGGITSIRIWNGTTTSATCETDYCTPRFTAPIVTATTTRTITGVFNWIGPQTATATLDVTIIPTRISNQITVSAATTTVRTGNTREVTARTGTLFSPRKIRIYMDGFLRKECDDDVICVLTELERSEVGTAHTFTAQAENLQGEIINSAPYVMTVVAQPSS